MRWLILSQTTSIKVKRKSQCSPLSHCLHYSMPSCPRLDLYSFVNKQTNKQTSVPMRVKSFGPTVQSSSPQTPFTSATHSTSLFLNSWNSSFPMPVSSILFQSRLPKSHFRTCHHYHSTSEITDFNIPLYDNNFPNFQFVW